MTATQPRILVVDDSEDNRYLLQRQLLRRNYGVVLAENGQQALDYVQSHTIDLMLLDIMMPVMNGFEVLQNLKQNEQLRHIPVIIVSAADDMENVVKGIQMGAEDYLAKPFNTTLLRARIEASLEKKRLHDQEQAYLQAIALEQAQSNRLLRNILPQTIADQLKDQQANIAEYFSSVSVLFADIVGFTELSGHINAQELVAWLNSLFSLFDQMTLDAGLEKIKTIGDAYMVAAGLPIAQPDHAERLALFATSVLAAIEQITMPNGQPLQMRIGIHSGPVVAGVIGTIKFSYDLWGDTVNIASRMESSAHPNTIQVSAETYALLQDHEHFSLQPRHGVEMKHLGTRTTYILNRHRHH
ncbi:MAG: response regulator [Chloroflexi bacterium]|nr:response regulator [Chloroflexota bacterium]